VTSLGFPAAEVPRRRRAGRRLALVIAVVAVLAALASAAVYGITRVTTVSDANYPGPGAGTVVVHVLAGDTATQIGQILLADGVVASVEAFRKAAEADPSSTGIEPGYYRLRSKMSAAEALRILVDPGNLIAARVTVPEGTSLKQLLPLIARDTAIPLAALERAVADPAALGLPSYAQGRVEGFLFPATYDVVPGTSAVGMLSMMVARFQVAAAQVGLVHGAAALGITPLQVVTIASILERESAGPADDPKVARVFYNRIAAGMPLGSEFTYNYAGGDATSPYNTYTHIGYPPGAYDSPGVASLTAALHPAPGNWLYFITLPDGTTVFETTEAGFQAAQQECIDQGGCQS
jgi:UPF0755 protein